jgi:uncharacterized membrane protein
MMITILALIYLMGITVVFSNAKRDGMLKVSDVIMIIVSPCMLIPILCLRITSFFIDVEKVLKTYDQNNA